jgi:pyruvate dehydrogenase E2 component (dihydrolipoamide acetyltransferase)
VRRHGFGARRRLPTLAAALLLLAAAAGAGDAPPWSDVQGTGEPTIVLLHGIGGDHDVWNRVAPSLAKNHRIVRIDLPGHGSSPPIDDVTVQNVARAVDRALEARHVERALLVGDSYGGWVALELAVAKPTRAAGVAVLDIGAYTPQDTARIASLERFLEERYVSLVRVIFETMSLDPPEADSAVARAFRVPPEVLGAYFRDSWRSDLRDRIRSSTTPIHVIATSAAWPASQPWEDARERAGYATKGPIEGHRIAGSGHLIMRDQPDSLVAVLERIAAGAASKGSRNRR